MNCPVCNVALNISERQGIEIDYCPQCRGIWLDRGELDKIIERSNAQLNEDVRPPRESGDKKYEDDRYDKDRYEKDKYYDKNTYKHRKKKSFFDDLFDF